MENFHEKNKDDTVLIIDETNKYKDRGIKVIVPYIEFKDGRKSDIVKVGVNATTETADFRGAVNLLSKEYWNNEFRQHYVDYKENLNIKEFKDIKKVDHIRNIEDIPLNEFVYAVEYFEDYRDLICIFDENDTRKLGDLDSTEFIYPYSLEVEGVEGFNESNDVTTEDYITYIEDLVYNNKVSIKGYLIEMDKYMMDLGSEAFTEEIFYLDIQDEDSKRMDIDLINDKMESVILNIVDSRLSGVNFMRDEITTNEEMYSNEENSLTVLETKNYSLKIKMFDLYEGDILFRLIYNATLGEDCEKISEVRSVICKKGRIAEDKNNEYLKYVTKVI